MSNFAKEHMMKHGWEEGKGLGKNEDGIAEALKPILKFNTAGIGYREDISSNWWETLYNSTIQNIKVESYNNESDTDHFNSDVSFSSFANNLIRYSAFKKIQENKPCEYRNFRKTSILDNGCLIQDASVKSEEEELTNDTVHIPLTDEQLYTACNGRTMHPTARLGFTLSGKLNRIAQQDKILQNISCLSELKSLNIKYTMAHRKTNTDLEKDQIECQKDIYKKTFPSEVKNSVVKSKSMKRRERRRINRLADQFSNFDIKESKNEEINLINFANYLPTEVVISSILTPEKANEKLGGVSSDRLSSKDYRKYDNLQMYKHEESTEKCKTWNSKLDKQASEIFQNTGSYCDHYYKFDKFDKFYELSLKSLPKIKHLKRKLNSKQKKKLRFAEKVIFTQNLRSEMLKLKENLVKNKISKEDLEQVEAEKYTDFSKMSYADFVNFAQTQSKDNIYKLSKERSHDSPTLHKSKNKIQKNVWYYHSRKKSHEVNHMKHIKKAIEKQQKNQQIVLADKLNSVIKDLTAVNLTEEVNVNAFKKKLTQTHLQPV